MSLKHALLAAILAKPQTGYDLAKHVDGSIRFFWAATLQQVYREVTTLEAEGLVVHKDVVQTDKPSKKVYRITPTGLDELTRWIGTEIDPTATKDAFTIKIFVGHIAPGALLKELERHISIHSARLAHYEEIRSKAFANVRELPVEAKYPYLALVKGIRLERAWLEWAAEAKEIISARTKGAQTKHGERGTHAKGRSSRVVTK